MTGNFTYSYVFQKNIAYGVSRANFLTYLTALLSPLGGTTCYGLSLGFVVILEENGSTEIGKVVVIFEFCRPLVLYGNCNKVEPPCLYVVCVC